jgi:hypothetical protein
MLPLLFAPIAAALALAGPGSEHVFGNWAVACDNVKRCEATMLMPESWSGEQAPGFDVAREAGPAGALTISISPVSKAGGVTDILIDRRLVGSGVLRDGTIRLSDATAEGLGRAMAGGHVLTLRQRSGTIATFSLAGASAALRYIDAEQGRSGTLTALVARGPKPAASVAGAQPLPRIAAIRPGRGKPAVLSKAQTAALRERAGCGEFDVSDTLAPAFYRLDAHSTLVAISCVSGAYQSSFALFVITDGRVAPAPFDYPPETDAEAKDAVPELAEPEWDPAAAALASHAKGRGLGDCGTDQSWVWDGARFRMTEYKALETCRLSGSWLTRYRAQPVFR